MAFINLDPVFVDNLGWSLSGLDLDGVDDWVEYAKLLEPVEIGEKMKFVETVARLVHDIVFLLQSRDQIELPIDLEKTHADTVRNAVGLLKDISIEDDTIQRGKFIIESLARARSYLLIFNTEKVYLLLSTDCDTEFGKFRGKYYCKDINRWQISMKCF